MTNLLPDKFSLCIVLYGVQSSGKTTGLLNLLPLDFKYKEKYGNSQSSSRFKYQILEFSPLIKKDEYMENEFFSHCKSFNEKSFIIIDTVGFIKFDQQEFIHLIQLTNLKHLVFKFIHFMIGDANVQKLVLNKEKFEPFSPQGIIYVFTKVLNLKREFKDPEEYDKYQKEVRKHFPNCTFVDFIEPYYNLPFFNSLIDSIYKEYIKSILDSTILNVDFYKKKKYVEIFQFEFEDKILDFQQEELMRIYLLNKFTSTREFRALLENSLFKDHFEEILDFYFYKDVFPKMMILKPFEKEIEGIKEKYEILKEEFADEFKLSISFDKANDFYQSIFQRLKFKLNSFVQIKIAEINIFNFNQESSQLLRILKHLQELNGDVSEIGKNVKQDIIKSLNNKTISILINEKKEKVNLINNLLSELSKKVEDEKEVFIFEMGGNIQNVDEEQVIIFENERIVQNVEDEKEILFEIEGNVQKKQRVEAHVYSKYDGAFRKHLNMIPKLDVDLTYLKEGIPKHQNIINAFEEMCQHDNYIGFYFQNIIKGCKPDRAFQYLYFMYICEKGTFTKNYFNELIEKYHDIGIIIKEDEIKKMLNTISFGDIFFYHDQLKGESIDQYFGEMIHNSSKRYFSLLKDKECLDYIKNIEDIDGALKTIQKNGKIVALKSSKKDM